MIAFPFSDCHCEKGSFVSVTAHAFYKKRGVLPTVYNTILIITPVMVFVNNRSPKRDPSDMEK